MALTRARVIFATGGFGRHVADAIRGILCHPVDRASLALEVQSMRRKLEESGRRNDLGRGIGGLADLEYLVQYLTLIHTATQPDLLRPNLWEALDALHRASILPAATHFELRQAYAFHRTVEGWLRLIHNRAIASLPETPAELLGLRRRLNYQVIVPEDSVASFLADATRHIATMRAAFDRYVAWQ